MKWFSSLIFPLIIFFPSNSSAQKFNYGVKGGVTLSGVSDLTYETHSKTGFSIYAFGDYNTSENFSVSTQTGYTQKGFSTNNFDYYTDKIHYYGAIYADLNYVDISVSGKLILHFKKVSPYISLGPSLGIKVNTGTSGTGNPEPSTRAEIQILLDEIYKNSLGIRTGAGVELHFIKNMSILLETDYSFDLISSYDAPDFRLGVETWYYSSNVKNNVLEFLVGVKF